MVGSEGRLALSAALAQMQDHQPPQAAAQALRDPGQGGDQEDPRVELRQQQAPDAQVHTVQVQEPQVRADEEGPFKVPAKDDVPRIHQAVQARRVSHDPRGSRPHLDQRRPV